MAKNVVSVGKLGFD